MTYTFDELKDYEQKIILAAKTAYISVMGEDKWNSLTEQEKHDAVMIPLKEMLIAMSGNPN